MCFTPMFVAQDGFTPLIYASLKGHEAVVKVLLAAGCDKEAKDEVSNGLLGC